MKDRIYKGYITPDNNEPVLAWLNDGSKKPHRLYKADGIWYSGNGYPLRSDEEVLKWKEA